MYFSVLATLLITTGANTIVELAQGSTDLSVLVEALVKSNLDSVFSGRGPFTVFAPTNQAFTDALTALGLTKEELLDKPDLAAILQYHVLSGAKVMSTDLKASQTPATLQGATVTITKSDTSPPKIMVGDAEVMVKDIEANNGVVHVIDKVLLPQTIVDMVKSSPDHTVLVEALVKANLVDALSGTGPFTVFAPTDKAFTDALTALGLTKEELLDKPDLADILKYHVLSGQVMSTDLTATQSPATLQGATVTITKGDKVMFADAEVTTADVAAAINGVVHVIDKVVLPPTIVDLAKSSPDHTVLVEALVKANLVKTLSDPGPFTVFAPTDKAFTDALTALGLTKQQLLDKADLAEILKYHVLGGKVMSTDLKATQSPATMQGATVTILKGDKVMFSDATVNPADLVASNGVVHVIDKVVLPPPPETTAEPVQEVNGAPAISSALACAIVMGIAIFHF